MKTLARRGLLAVFATLAVGLALVGRAALYRAADAHAATQLYDLGEPFDEPPERIRAIERAGRLIAPLHETKRPTRPGDWLALHGEAGETFAAYRTGAPMRPSGRFTTLYLQQWGDFDAPRRQIHELTAELLRRF
jgi:hypothetical protein